MTLSRSIAVIGAGAVGGYLGAHLSRNRDGEESPFAVTMVARPAQADAISRRGLVLRSGLEETVSYPRVTSSPAELSPVDLTVLCVRNYDVVTSLPIARRLMGASGFLLAMQNGVGNEQVLANAVGPERVIVGTLTSSVVSEKPGVIRRTSMSGGVALAGMTGGLLPDWIVSGFRGSGIAADTVSEYRSLLWSKLLLNMLGAATSAILDIDLGSLVADPRLFRLEQLAFREATRVMDRLGIRTVNLPGYAVKLAQYSMRLPLPLARRLVGPRIARSRGGHSPAMRVDIQRGKTEVRWLNGAVTTAASAANVPAPVNTALTNLTETLTGHPERRAEYMGRPDKLISYLEHHGVSL